MRNYHVGRKIRHWTVQSNKVSYSLVEHFTPSIELSWVNCFASNLIFPLLFDAHILDWQVFLFTFIIHCKRIFHHLEEEFPVTWLDIDALIVRVIDCIHQDEVRVNLNRTIPSKQNADLIPTAAVLIKARRGDETKQWWSMPTNKGLVLDTKSIQLQLLLTNLIQYNFESKETDLVRLSIFNHKARLLIGEFWKHHDTLAGLQYDFPQLLSWDLDLLLDLLRRVQVVLNIKIYKSIRIVHC